MQRNTLSKIEVSFDIAYTAIFYYTVHRVAILCFILFDQWQQYGEQ